MQPLVVDMGGSNNRKFASNADYYKVRKAQSIRVKNAADAALNGVYHAVASLNDVNADVLIGVPEGAGVAPFIRSQAQDYSGEFSGSQYALVYIDGHDTGIIVSEY